MKLMPALQIELARHDGKLCKRILQMRQGNGKFGAWAHARSATQQQFDAQIGLQRLDPLTDGGRRDAECFSRNRERTGADCKFERLKRP